MGDDPVALDLRRQADACRSLASPLTGALLDGAAADYVAQGVVHRLLRDFPDDPLASALSLRLAGALHHLVLSGRAPALAAHYPSAGGSWNVQATAELWHAAAATLAQHEREVRTFLTLPPQTNEVGRSGVLLGGFLEVARRTGLPLALREIGASAGLNLFWDQYRYDLGEAQWGDPASPVRIACQWRGSCPDLTTPVEVASRRGCDPNPLPIATDSDRLRVAAYVWADQTERLARQRAAMAIAAARPSPIQVAGAAAWIEAELFRRQRGETLVVYHSIVMQYIPKAERSRFRALLANVGETATDRTPLAWLAMEPFRVGKRFEYELTLTLWPGGREERLATRVHPHGHKANWTLGTVRE